MLDACPHRGVELSLGIVLDNGCLQCPYHGWQFDADGGCVKIPYAELSKEAIEKMGATRIHHKIAGGALWVFTGTDPTPFNPSEMLFSEERFFLIQAQEWQAHWSRVAENSMDQYERSVPSDAHALKFRSWYYKTFKNKVREPLPAGSASLLCPLKLNLFQSKQHGLISRRLPVGQS